MSRFGHGRLTPPQGTQELHLRVEKMPLPTPSPSKRTKLAMAPTTLSSAVLKYEKGIKKRRVGGCLQPYIRQQGVVRRSGFRCVIHSVQEDAQPFDGYSMCLANRNKEFVMSVRLRCEDFCATTCKSEYVLWPCSMQYSSTLQ